MYVYIFIMHILKKYVSTNMYVKAITVALPYTY